MAYSASGDYSFASASFTSGQLTAWIADANGLINEHLGITSDTTVNAKTLKIMEKQLVTMEWSYMKSLTAVQGQMIQNPFGGALLTEARNQPMHLTEEMKTTLNLTKLKILNQQRIRVVDT
jgi:hypothetical protein